MEDKKIEEAQKLIETLISSIFGGEFSISSKQNAFGVSFIVDTEDKELKKSIIGKNGRNLRAIRRLLRIWSVKNKFLIGIFVPGEKIAQ